MKLISTKPIHTTCNCGKSAIMLWNGNYHSVNCSCGRNIRQKGADLIIELKN